MNLYVTVKIVYVSTFCVQLCETAAVEACLEKSQFNLEQPPVSFLFSSKKQVFSANIFLFWFVLKQKPLFEQHCNLYFSIVSDDV